MASIQTRGSIEINRPINDVFRSTTEHVPEWSSIVVEETVLTQNADGSTATFRTVTEDRGQRMEFEGEVIKHEPPHASVVLMSGKQFELHVAYMFEEIGGSTRVTQVSDVTPNSTAMKILFFLSGWLMKSASCKALEKELNLLKSFCESHTS